MELVEQPHRLVAALSRLTRCGKARWARRPIDPGFVLCLAGDELIRFELSQARQGFNPSEPVHGIHGVFGNVDFLWLKDLGGWDELLTLIQAAPVSDDEYAAILRHAKSTVLRRLERFEVPLRSGELPQG